MVMDINNFDLKLRNDIENVFKNEIFIEFLDWIVEKDCITTELYYVGYGGKKSFYNKVDKYVNKLKNLGYEISVKKDIYSWNDCNDEYDYYIQLYFNLN